MFVLVPKQKSKVQSSSNIDEFVPEGEMDSKFFEDDEEEDDEESEEDRYVWNTLMFDIGM